MRYFIVYAHPEPRSLTGHLKDNAVAALLAAGHEVVVSDLYAMKWKAVADEGDFPMRRQTSEPLDYERASKEAFTTGTQAPDVTAEQEKLLWADVVVLHFPIWWYGMPAILKGWVDRVYAYGFAYGVGPHGGPDWGKRFGEGTLQGRRGMVAMMVGGRMAHYGPRGVNGAMDDLLWPIEHGVLFYPGMSVLPPVTFYELGRADESVVAEMTRIYCGRLLAAATTEPIPMRTQNGGDYNDVQVLREELLGGKSGHSLHQADPVFVPNTWLGKAGDYTPRHFAPTSRDPDIHGST
ncbi:NAD(P)H-dependent oxidoreductase [Luteibacter aegosomatissinici]|uniref:NAD(P)H-dependent oxidoreductase n=1 Tax=Luteibacter aegosomatissinici TaxID=2911539 RepID=UPI001FFA368A|nr:NAD(P)H-dependent oxidoreductase [Luteibacter aegosomatissinici]UPG92727.1 NAD(P)H-dependent oxidoreductase [Luteibacter aegosomatissinici]